MEEGKSIPDLCDEIQARLDHYVAEADERTAQHLAHLIRIEAHSAGWAQGFCWGFATPLALAAIWWLLSPR